MNKQINFSIVIPHRNIPKLLQRCLNSIPRREDIQIIVVDDNSDPSIVDFEQFPCINDPFVEIIFSKEGKGAGHVRNVGLTRAVGKWLLFADADDFFCYCLNDAFNEYLNSDVDIIYFKHNCIDSDTYITRERCENYNTFINFWLQNSRKADVLLRYRHASVWAKFIKMEFVNKNKIMFDVVSIANDVTFAYLIGFHAISIHADPRALYCTTIRKNSIRHQNKSAQMKLDNFYVGCKRHHFFTNNNIPISCDISHVRSLINFYFYDRYYFDMAKNILFKLGFTSSKILILCLRYLLLYKLKKHIVRLSYFPRKIALKYFPDDGFLSVLHLKLKKQQSKNFLNNRKHEE